MLKKMLLGLMYCVLTASLAMAQVKVVKLRDGRSLTGTVKKIEGGYEVTGRFAKITVAASQVLRIEDVTTPEDEYLQRLKKIDRNNPDERYALGEWAMSRGLLRIAAAEFEAALQVDPTYEKASLLLKQVRTRQARAKNRAGRRTKTPSSKRDKTQFITSKDISRMRLAELAEGEAIRFIMSKKTLKKFLTSAEGSDDARKDPDFARKFRRRTSRRQLEYILKETYPDNWDILDGIKLRTDPKAFKTFRRKVWPLVARNCSTVKCHGAPKGKAELKLHLSASDDIGVYTNFLILDMFEKEGRRVINRGDPARSLLLEYGLAIRDAKTPHPGKKIKPMFRDLKDPRYLTIEKWIGSLKGPPHPNYGVTFEPPFGPKRETFDPLDRPDKKKDKTQESTTTQPAEPKKKVIRPM